MDGKDQDFFRIETPDGARELHVKLINKSTTLRPRISVFGNDKSLLAQKYNTTGGADLTLSIPRKRDETFHLQVGDYYGDAAGSYELTVTSSE